MPDRPVPPVRPPGRRRAAFRAALLLAGVALGSALVAGAEPPPYRVLKVYDGDTLRVAGPQGDHVVRLVGIDAPETGKGPGRPGQPFSGRARSHLRDRVLGRRVALVQYGLDTYRRVLAEVILDGRNLNLEILEAGLAEVYRGRTPPELDLAVFRRAEAAARAQGRGIWSQGGRYRSPLEWKHPP